MLGAVTWATRFWPWPSGTSAERHRNRDAQRLFGTERLAMVAHELRTPLGAIRHAAEMLEAPGDAPAHVQAACAIIRRQVERAGRLVEDLLVPSESRHARLGLGLEPLDLAALLTETVDALRGLVEERGHRLTLALPPGPHVVRGDAGRLAQVVTNLIWNAAKFTPAGGHVDVMLASEGGEVLIRVRDNGIGMAPAMRDRIFRLFTRAAPTADTGRGIGLALAELIIARHGGHITVHSDGPGCGSEFVVRLPGAAVVLGGGADAAGEEDVPGLAAERGQSPYVAAADRRGAQA
jgi:signal transduction histidine kinase